MQTNLNTQAQHTSEMDGRYDKVCCPHCGDEYQLIDFGCARHELWHSAVGLPPVTAAFTALAAAKVTK